MDLQTALKAIDLKVCFKDITQERWMQHTTFGTWKVFMVRHVNAVRIYNTLLIETDDEEQAVDVLIHGEVAA